MSLSTILIIIWLLMLLSVIPVWLYSIDWNYTHSGAVVLALIVIVVLVLGSRL